MSLNTILATAPLTATGYHLKATGTALGQSLIWDNGTNVGIGNQGTTYTLDVTGTGRFTSSLTATKVILSLGADQAELTSAFNNDFKLTNSGAFRIINNANTVALLTVTNVGAATLNGTLQVTTTSYNGLTITTNDVATLKMTNSAGSTKNWGFATTNTAASDFGIYQSTSAGGDPISAGTPRLYFNGAGYTKITNNGTYEYVSAAVHEIRNSAADYILYATNPNANPSGYYISYPGASPNGLANYFIACADSTAARFRVASNGNCYNVTGTYTSGVSDIRYKEQIVDANSQWNDIKNLRVVNFKFIKDVEENGDNALRHIGFIAQEVEKTSPHLIDEMSDEKTGETWKTIKTSIIHTKSIKALQEAMARIETLESTIQNLQEQINILAK